MLMWTTPMSGQVVFEDLEKITSEIEAPNEKIIISELTTRNDKRDPEVQLCNACIKLMKVNNCHHNVTIVCHQNSRNSDWTFHYDGKHLFKISIARFALNLKSSFRKAFGIYKSKPLSRDNKGYHHQQQDNNAKYSNNGSWKSLKAELLSMLTSFLSC